MKYSSGQYRILLFDVADNCIFISKVVQGYEVGMIFSRYHKPEMYPSYELDGRYTIPLIEFARYEVVYVEEQGMSIPRIGH